mmetsp:Transcript_27088/g.31251  ORF Transcript_27088/g.31251 Transcript_27088/m.31251 type:complete len:116 (-) Transcript_27088:825-1172(-)
MDYEFDNDAEFVSEQVTEIAKSALESVFQNDNIQYSKDKVDSWCHTIIEACIKDLVKLQKPFKYVVTCIIMEKNGAGLQTAATAFWDAKTDGLCSVQLENKATFDCIVTIFAMQI